MRKKAFTLIFVPHSKGSARSLSLSEKALKWLIAGASFLVLLATCFLVDYFSMSHVRQKYRTLLKESVVQKETLEKFKATVSQLQKTVDNFENYAKKLNVMAGLKAPGVKEVGVGDGGAVGGGAIPAAPQDLSLSDVQSIHWKAESLEKNLGTLVLFFENQAARLASTPTIWPTAGWLISGFGVRKDPFTGLYTFHRGIDIATNQGNPVVATADGTVAQVKYDKLGGNMVILSHGHDLSTAYMHLDKFLVREGQRVKRGDVIGLVGRTGKALGPHVHYEVRIGGKPVNPYSYILEE